MFSSLADVYSFNDSGLNNQNSITACLTTQLPEIFNKGYSEPGAPGTETGKGPEQVEAGGVVGGVKYEEKIVVGGKVKKDYLPNTAPFLLDKFESHILSYVDKYLEVVKSLKEAFEKIDILRRENDHYKKKVDALTTKELKKNEKSGGIEQTSEKLGRNRDKFNAALLRYTNTSNALIFAVNDMTDNGWKELQPLVLKLIQFERSYCVVGNNVATELGVEEAKLKAIGNEHKLTEASGFKR